jgi:hypothetical protein
LDTLRGTYERMLKSDFHTLEADAFEQQHPIPRHYVPWKSYLQYWAEKKAEMDGWHTHLLDNRDTITQTPAIPSQFTEVNLDNLSRMILARCNAAKRTYRTFMNMPPKQMDSTRTAHVTRTFLDIRRTKHDIDIEVAVQRTFLRHQLTSTGDASERRSIGPAVLPQGDNGKSRHVLDEGALRSNLGEGEAMPKEKSTWLTDAGALKDRIATSQETTKTKDITISAETHELRLELDGSNNRMRTLQQPAWDTTEQAEAIMKPEESNKTIVDGRLSPTSRLRTNSEPTVGEELSPDSHTSASTYPYSEGLVHQTVPHSTEQGVVCLRDTSTGHAPVPTTPSVASAEGQVTLDRDLPGTEAGSQHTGSVSDNAWSEWDNTGDLNTPPETTAEDPFEDITAQEDLEQKLTDFPDLTVQERALLAETKRWGNRSGYPNGGVVMEIQAHLGQIP